MDSRGLDTRDRHCFLCTAVTCGIIEIEKEMADCVISKTMFLM